VAARRRKATDPADLVADYQQTFGTPHGRRVVGDLIKRFGVFQRRTVPNDGISSAYNDGVAAPVLHILNTVGVDLADMKSVTDARTEHDA